MTTPNLSELLQSLLNRNMGGSWTLSGEYLLNVKGVRSDTPSRILKRSSSDSCDFTVSLMIESSTPSSGQERLLELLSFTEGLGLALNSVLNTLKSAERDYKQALFLAEQERSSNNGNSDH